MQQIIFKSKGSGKVVIIVGVILVILSIVLMACLGKYAFEGSDSAGQIISIIPFLLPLGLGTFLIGYGIKFSKTNILVYEEHIEGTCVVKKMNRRFYLKYEKIGNVSIEKGVLLIQSDGVTHQVFLSSKEVKPIFEYINDRI